MTKGNGFVEVGKWKWGKVSTEMSNVKLININTAGVSELMTLPGIGESRANDIIRYRTENGGFGCIEDIKKVSGIKDAAYSKIKDLIQV